MNQRTISRFLLLVCVVLNSACTGLSNAVFDAVKVAYKGSNHNFQSEKLKPALVYLEVKTPKASALLVLGYVDEDKGSHLPLQSWFSGSGDVLRTEGGFIASSSGQPEFWKNTKLTFNKSNLEFARFDLPEEGLYGLNHAFKVLGPVFHPTTSLMRRAAILPSIVLTAYESHWINAPDNEQTKKWMPIYGKLSYVIGLDSRNGEMVYGLNCLRADFCVEYLKRTAAENL